MWAIEGQRERELHSLSLKFARIIQAKATLNTYLSSMLDLIGKTTVHDPVGAVA